MAKDLGRRIERIEQQQIPEAPSESNLIELIFGGLCTVMPSKQQFSRMLRQAIEQVDGRSRLIPGQPQVSLKGNSQ
jgi:hypothetical protein